MSSSSSIDSIKNHISKAQEQYPSVEQSISQLSERIKRSKEEMSELENSVRQTTSVANELNQKISSDLSILNHYLSRHKEISQDKEHSDKYTDSLTQLEFKIEVYQAQIQSRKLEYSENQKELSRLKQSLSAKQQEITDLSQELSKRRSSCGKLANSLVTHARILDNQTRVLKEQERGFNSVSTNSFAQQSSNSAAQSRSTKISSNITATIIATKLAQRYAKLAQTTISDSILNHHCLGVLTQGKLPTEYVEILNDRYTKAVPNVKKVFDHYAKYLMIRDSNYPSNETAHYTPLGSENHPRGVYYNSRSDMNNPRGPGSTYFHELAHMIDHASTGYQRNLSNTPEFGNALVEDGQRILSLYNSLPPEKQAALLSRISQDSAHSLSDLIDATTSGQLHGRYGHSSEYWTYQGNLQAEAFAHFFEASMGDGNKLNLLSNFFPTSYSVFSNMIESAQPARFS